MTATFTADGIAPWSPILIIGDDTNRAARATVHELLGGSTPAVSFLPTLARSGRLELLVQDASSAAAGITLFGAARPIQLTDVDRPDRSMRFVVTGPVTQQTDTRTESRLIKIDVPFQEVPL